ncbi:hypothetical protein [Clostridium polynesiense]|uniref:hypothetical protein n=1 Tax=Clostridium polynesiense TaxID=1325933 RepID=UPI00069485D9|nr:hypothetical protein [Clostridium polynesiense]
MSEVIIKGVGKKIIIIDNTIRITKIIGKEVELNLKNIIDISFTKGTLNENGRISIKGKRLDGKNIEEKVDFWYTQNNIVEEIVDKIKIAISSEEAEMAPITLENSDKVSLWKQLNTESDERIQKVKDMKKAGIVFCPKCHSTSITTTDKKLSLGRTLAGGVLAGEVGAILGGLSSKKVLLLCMNCGHKWKPGKK